MRAFCLAPLPVGVVFFRDPVLRAAIVVKTTWRIVERPVPSLSIEPTSSPLSLERPFPDAPGFAAHGNDFAPRKARVDLTVVGRAHSAEPRPSFPIEVLLGRTVRKRVGVVAGAPSLTAPLRTTTLRTEGGQPTWLGPVVTAVSPSPARDERESWWSDRWVELAPGERGDRFQIAPSDQQTWETVGPGSTLQLTNLSRGGGVVGFALPNATPWVICVEVARVARQAIPLRLDTLHVDTEVRTIEALYRGEIELGRLTSRPDLIVGLSAGRETPQWSEIEAGLGSVRPSLVQEPWPRMSAAPPSGSVGVSGTLLTARSTNRGPFQEPAPQSAPAGTGTVLATPRSSPTHEALPFERLPARTVRGPTWRGGVEAPEAQSRKVGGWTLGDLVASYGDRAVFIATHEERGQLGRLSMVHSALVHNSALMAAFQLEVERRSRVLHPAIAGILDQGVAEDGSPYVVDAIASGRSLADIARDKPSSHTEAIQWLDGALGAVEAIHASGFVHGALRAKLVFVDGDKVTIHLTDALRPPGQRPAEQHTHEPAHGPPELAREEWEMIDERSDVWFAAAVFFHAVTGAPIHDAKSDHKKLLLAAMEPAPKMSVVAPQVPAALAAVIDRALAADPAARHATASELRRELREVAARELGLEVPEAAEAYRAPLDTIDEEDDGDRATQRPVAPSEDDDDDVKTPVPPRPRTLPAGLEGDGAEEDDDRSTTGVHQAVLELPAPGAPAVFRTIAEFEELSTTSMRSDPIEDRAALPPAAGDVEVTADDDVDMDESPSHTALVSLAAVRREVESALPFRGAASAPPPSAPSIHADTGTVFGSRSPARALPFAEPRPPALPFSPEGTAVGPLPARPVEPNTGTGTVMGGRSPAAGALPFSRSSRDQEHTGVSDEILSIAAALRGGGSDSLPFRSKATTAPAQQARSGDGALPFAQSPPRSAPAPVAPPPSFRSIVAQAPAAVPYVPPGAESPDRQTVVAAPVAARNEPRRVTVPAAAMAKILVAPDAAIDSVLSELPLSRLAAARARQSWAAEIDRQLRAGETTKLDELLSALHAETLARR